MIRVDTSACVFDAITNADGLGVIEVSFCFLAPAVAVEVLEIGIFNRDNEILYGL